MKIMCSRISFHVRIIHPLYGIGTGKDASDLLRRIQEYIK